MKILGIQTGHDVVHSILENGTVFLGQILITYIL